MNQVPRMSKAFLKNDCKTVFLNTFKLSVFFFFSQNNVFWRMFEKQIFLILVFETTSSFRTFLLTKQCYRYSSLLFLFYFLFVALLISQKNAPFDMLCSDWCIPTCKLLRILSTLFSLFYYWTVTLYMYFVRQWDVSHPSAALINTLCPS